jgi:YVTN family beta-propeller protein
MHCKLLVTGLSLVSLLGCVPMPPGGTTPVAATMQAAARIPAGANPGTLAFGQGYLYVANMGAGTVSVLDLSQNAKVTEVKVGGVPGYTTATPDGKTVATVDRTGKVRLIDPANGHLVLQTLDVGQVPCHAVFLDDGKRLAVTLTEEPLVKVFTFADGFAKAPTVASYTVGTVAGPAAATGMAGGMTTPMAGGMTTPMAGGMAPMAPMKMRGLVFAKNRLLTPNSGDNTASLVDLGSGQVTTLPAGNNPTAVGLSLDGRYAVVGNTASHTALIVEIATGQAKTVAVGQAPGDIAMSCCGTMAFTANSGSNDVSVLDLEKGTEVQRIPVGRRPGAIYAHDGKIWVMNNDDATVSVIDGLDLKVKATVSVGQGKHFAAFGADKVFVSSATSGDVAVIDPRTFK